MTKPMATGCIKDHPSPCSMIKFNLLLETVHLDDEIGHLFVVDIEFNEKATKWQILYNEIMPPITEKQKILEVNERSVYQLLNLIRKTSDGVPKAYRCTQKSHATLFPKKYIPLYLEDLKFLI